MSRRSSSTLRGKYHVYQLCDIDLEEVRQTLEASAITGCDEVASRCNRTVGLPLACGSRADSLVRDSCD